LTAQRLSPLTALRASDVTVGHAGAAHAPEALAAGALGALLLAPVQSASPTPELGLHGLSHALIVFGHGQQLGLVDDGMPSLCMLATDLEPAQAGLTLMRAPLSPPGGSA
jgi:hypothetical protein